MLGDGQEGSAIGKLSRSPAQLNGYSTARVYMAVEDVDAHYDKAKAEGAEIALDRKCEEYGGRGCICKNLEGHIWRFGSYDPWN